jgi:hypothetical protein
MTKSNSGLGCLIVFVGLGFFLLFNSRFMFFSPMFIMIIIGIVMISIITSAMHRKDPYEGSVQYRKQDSNISYQNPRRNPYIMTYVQDSNQGITPKINEEVITKPENTRYCQYCGVEREEEAIYCHNCGTKLTLD